MERTRTEKRFVDYGCGFPIVIYDVPVIRVRGIWTPDVDYNELHEKVLRALACNPEQLTGNQIKFIRHFFSLTLVEFGEYFDVSHPAVLKWESAGDDAPSIKWSLERDLRLSIMDRLGEGSIAVGNLYGELRSKARQPSGNELDLGTLVRESVVFNRANSLDNVIEFPASSTACNRDYHTVDSLDPIESVTNEPNAQNN